MVSDQTHARSTKQRHVFDGIGHMEIGEVAYTTPWGMWVDSQRRCWLHPDYTAKDRIQGTVRMRVERHEDGFHVWLPEDERWTLQEGPGYVSPAETQYIPVVELHFDSRPEVPEENELPRKRFFDFFSKKTEELFTPRPQYALLPEEYEEYTVDKMKVGDAGFTQPWGMWLNRQGQYWLHPKYTVHPTPGGTASMRVVREPEGFHVKPRDGSWEPTDTPPYASPASTQYIPVVEFD